MTDAGAHTALLRALRTTMGPEARRPERDRLVVRRARGLTTTIIAFPLMAA